MITTVTLNPAIDRTIVVEKFEFGAVNRVVSVREDMGGKGINVARILTALGSEATAVGFIGSANLSHVQTLLGRDAIPTDFVRVNAATRLNTKLITRDTRTTTDINEAGFEVSQSNLDALKEKIKLYASSSSFVVFSGSVPRGLPIDVYRDLIRQVTPLSKPVLDADGELLMAGLQAHPYLIKPNIHELENALGRPLQSHVEIVSAARTLISQYGITYVLVSMGGNGSILVSPSAALFAAPVMVAVRGTVGAGDSMLAGFLHCLSAEMPDKQALAWATACGALAVSKEGTEAFQKQDVIQLAAQVTITPVID